MRLLTQSDLHTSSPSFGTSKRCFFGWLEKIIRYTDCFYAFLGRTHLLLNRRGPTLRSITPCCFWKCLVVESISKTCCSQKLFHSCDGSRHGLVAQISAFAFSPWDARQFGALKLHGTWTWWLQYLRARMMNFRSSWSKWQHIFFCTKIHTKIHRGGHFNYTNFMQIFKVKTIPGGNSPSPGIL